MDMLRARMGAGSYLLSMSALMIVWSLATIYFCRYYLARHSISTGQLNSIMTVFAVLVGSVFFNFSARRLRDLNFPGWSVKILAFPFFAVIVLPLLCFLSGPRWENNYGEPPPPSGFMKVLLAITLFFVAIPLTQEALYAYSKARYALLQLGL